MKKLIYFLGTLSFLLFACTISTTVTPPPTAAPAASEVSPTPTVTALPTEPPAPQTNTTCNGVALFLDPALASGFSCQSMPEVSNQGGPGMDVNPPYTEITLTGYVLSERFFTPKIDVYPVQRFSELVPDVIPARVAALQALIVGGPTGDKGLPLLPLFNAAQEFVARYQVLSFGSGGGIRYLTEYAQYFDPANNHDLFYTFQGLTADGKYWVSAILPISHPLLPADGNNPPNGQSGDDFTNNFPKYLADITAQLNSQPPESFSPAMGMLDALVASIRVKP